MTFLLDASVSRYRRPLKIRDFVWEIKYWDLRTLNNVKSNFSFNEIIKKTYLASEDLSILFLIQSLLFSTVTCNVTPTSPAERSRVTSLGGFGLPVMSRKNWIGPNKYDISLWERIVIFHLKIGAIRDRPKFALSVLTRTAEKKKRKKRKKMWSAEVFNSKWQGAVA